MNLEQIITLQFKKPCPACNKPALLPGKQTQFYVDENKKKMAIKCMNCGTMLDLIMTEKQYDEAWKRLKGFKIPIV